MDKEFGGGCKKEKEGAKYPRAGRLFCGLDASANGRWSYLALYPKTILDYRLRVPPDEQKHARKPKPKKSVRCRKMCRPKL